MSDESPRKTWKHLRADGDNPTLAVSDSDKLARDADGRALAREEAKWRAVFDAGIVSVESVPILRDEVQWGKCDDVEVRVLLRARGGAKVAEIMRDDTYSREEIVHAICRLAGRGVLRIP